MNYTTLSDADDAEVVFFFFSFLFSSSLDAQTSCWLVGGGGGGLDSGEFLILFACLLVPVLLLLSWCGVPAEGVLHALPMHLCLARFAVCVSMHTKASEIPLMFACDGAEMTVQAVPVLAVVRSSSSSSIVEPNGLFFFDERGSCCVVAAARGSRQLSFRYEMGSWF